MKRKMLTLLRPLIAHWPLPKALCLILSDGIITLNLGL